MFVCVCWAPCSDSYSSSGAGPAATRVGGASGGESVLLVNGEERVDSYGATLSNSGHGDGGGVAASKRIRIWSIYVIHTSTCTCNYTVYVCNIHSIYMYGEFSMGEIEGMLFFLLPVR